MADMTIRNLGRELWRRLLIRAAAYGRTVEEETRAIWSDVLIGSPGAEQATSGAWTAELQPLAWETGAVELQIPEREGGYGVHRIPDFGATTPSSGREP